MNTEKENYFVPENLGNTKNPIMSPSGKYKLIISTYGTKKGCWDYSRGQVYKDDTLIADVKRNYSSFWFDWIEDHPNGHDYLFCGEDYQGQTLIELDTGKRRDTLSDGSDKGWGFCWVEAQPSPDKLIVVAQGCYWACPYEFKFFDFSDPMNGFPELQNDSGALADNRPPTFEKDGTIKTYESEYVEMPDDAPDDWERPMGNLNSVKTFKREGNQLVLLDEWVSEKEKESRKRQDEYDEKFEKETTDWINNSPYYAELNKQIKNNPEFNPTGYACWGFGTGNDWPPNYEISNERTYIKTLHSRKSTVENSNEGKLSISIYIACETGRVKLEVGKNGKGAGYKYFIGEGVEPIIQACDYTKKIINGEDDDKC